ncbi:MAG: aldehyde dehydrogenase [Flavobacteriaceae bacterium]|nr:aldehyde dehydrogenase [Flavobacteriaceae bacterium]
MEHITEIITKQDSFFTSQITKSIGFRLGLLKKLRTELISREEEINKALYADFKKPAFESLISETGVVLIELNKVIRNLRKWARPKAVFPAMLNFPSYSKIYKDPLGKVLIIAPWNYPFQLALAPVIGAIAAGNTVVLKPSELASNTASLVQRIISTVFDQSHVAVIEGGVETSQFLLKQRWDFIFFTGSVAVGKIVAKAAAAHLTPVTLELGGKNPCIIDETTDLKLAAKRLVWGKFLNAGQTCIAPDYFLVHSSIKSDFIAEFSKAINATYGEDAQKSPDYPRIINTRNFDRLEKMLVGVDIVYGGKKDRDDVFIGPTLIDSPAMDSEVMKDEIFGPISPVFSYENEADIDRFMTHYEKPLSLYIFSKRKAFIASILEKHSFGGGCINDTLIHFVNDRLPFGGVGNSGMGAYHGKRSFDTFSHHKSITKRYSWPDLPIRYAPYKGKYKLLKSMLKIIG